ncbi:MAG: histidine kinase [Clostridia bacterium]|nr:histidine kinase [Clostridia bacterium]
MKRFFHSLKFNMLLPVMAMALGITLVLTFVISETYTRTILSQEEDKTRVSFSIAGGAIGEGLRSAQSAATRTMLGTDIIHYAMRSYRTDVEMVRARQACVDSFSATISQQPYLYGLMFMRPDGSFFGVLPYRNYFVDDPADNVFFDRETLGSILENEGKLTWMNGLDAAALYGFSSGQIQARLPSGIIMGCCRCHDRQAGYFYLLLFVDVSSLRERMELMADGSSTLYLVTADGTRLSRAGQERSASPMGADALVKSEDDGRVALTEEGERVYVMAERIPDCGWYLVKEMPMAVYDSTARSLRVTVWVTAAAVLAAFVLLYMIWLRRYIRTFDSLRSGIRRTGEGELSTRLDAAYTINEFEDIRIGFNDMNRSLEELMETTRRMERDRVELEMRNLQTQLSPHMIFNSITAIRWMSTMLGADSVSDMLMELSEMLRPVLREWRLRWTLGEELEHLRHYTRLLDLRFKNRFRLECAIPEEYYPIMLPRFTLQPLVENACEHGGHPRDALVVKIDAALTGDRMLLTVQNNGRDITDEEIARVREMLASGSRGKSIGLKNVYGRLAICMGKDSTLDIERPAEGGTRVVISWRVRGENGPAVDVKKIAEHPELTEAAGPAAPRGEDHDGGRKKDGSGER